MAENTKRITTFKRLSETNKEEKKKRVREKDEKGHSEVTVCGNTTTAKKKKNDAAPITQPDKDISKGLFARSWRAMMKTQRILFCHFDIFRFLSPSSAQNAKLKKKLRNTPGGNWQNKTSTNALTFFFFAYVA